MKNLFIKLKIVQVISNEQRHKDGLKRLGKGFFKTYRLNPFNPLNYILVIVTIPFILLMYGFIGSFEKAINPFRWN